MIRHVDATLKLMTVITGDDRYAKVGQEMVAEGKGENASMSDFFSRAIAKGEARGEARGIRIGEARAREAYQEELAQKNREIDELYRQLAKYQAKETCRRE